MASGGGGIADNTRQTVVVDRPLVSGITRLPLPRGSLRSHRMSISSILPLLVAAATQADTVVTRVIPVRGVLDWTSMILQLVVLLLGVASLITLVMLLMTVRHGVAKANAIMEQFAADAKPLLTKATEVATDAREVVAMLRTDVERVTEAAEAISDQLLDAADITARRVDEVNAVLDVLQGELEGTAISAAAAMRGVRAGTRALGKDRRKRRERDDDAQS